MFVMEAAFAKFNPIENSESHSSIETASSLLGIDPVLHKLFSDRLHSAHGHARIWVHPLYTEQWPGTGRGTLNVTNLVDVQEKLRGSFLRTVDSVVRNPKSSPLFVYEAEAKTDETKKIIAEHIGTSPEELAELGILFIPTEAGSSMLDVKSEIRALYKGNNNEVRLAEKLNTYQEGLESYIEVSKSLRESRVKAFPEFEDDSYALSSRERRNEYLSRLKADRDEAKTYKTYSFNERAEIEAKVMIGIYQSLGLQSSLVSGAYLTVGKDHETKKAILDACAGHVVTMLREANIPTDISNNIWPPKELIREAGFELKQTGSIQAPHQHNDEPH